jgi:prolipoprotein diacylglyceryltransferase
MVWASVVILSFVGLFGVIYAVYVGFKMANANDDTKRNQAKNHLLYAIIGVVATALIASVLFGVIPMLEGLTSGMSATELEKNAVLKKDWIMFGLLAKGILSVLTNVSVLFGTWVGWQLVKAETDEKRIQAKKQILFTALAILVVLGLQSAATAMLNALHVK